MGSGGSGHPLPDDSMTTRIPAQAEAPSAAARKVVTVLFCDAVGSTDLGEFGRTVANVPGSQEGVAPRVVVGAPASGTERAGQVFVFAGDTGAQLFVFDGEHTGDRFGQTLAPAPAEVSQNAMVVLYPAWLPPEGERVRGVEALGQRLLTLAGPLLVLVVGLMPAAR